MAKLHIVSIGGTGHKVLTSLINLAACGAFRNREVTEINIICLDGDYANGNLERMVNTYKYYNGLYQALNIPNVDDLIKINSVVPNLFISLYQDGNESLKRAFNLTAYTAGTPEDELIRFLYTDNEIDQEFKGGFYGHTSIGAVMARNILTDIKKQEGKDWANFKEKITDNDIVVVLGSIFGGTGASCIPVVLEDLKEKKKNGSCLAAVILSPYFNILGETDENKKLQPNSNNFNIKAKAALNYYEIEKKLVATDALYIIGEPSDNFSNEIKHDDGAKQKNKAHPIELFAATAILDFIKNNQNRRKSKVYVAKRPCFNKLYCYTWEMLQDVDKDLHILMQSFTKAAIFYNKVLFPQLKNNNSAGFWEDFYDDGDFTLQTKMDTENKYYYNKIYDYMRYFIKWIFEIHKKNSEEILENGELKREIDTRVFLFNAEYEDLFSITEYSSGKVKQFENLVVNEVGKKSEEILLELNNRQPKNGTSFSALFDTLKSILKEKLPENKKQKIIPKKYSADQMKMTNYVSQDNYVDLGVPHDAKSLFWVECPNAKILGLIAENLPNTDRKMYTKNDVAIPSPWSIFITNEMSLTIPKFKGLNEYAYNQWCGLIALLVLRNLNNYEQGHQLEIKELKWSCPNDPFFTTIKDLSCPTNYIFGDKIADWLDCSIVKLGNETIAFLAHNTFICPVFSISKIAKTKLHDFEPTIVGSDGEFQNPSGYFVGRDDSNRSKKYLQLVLKWLENQLSSLSKKDKNDQIIESMKNLIKNYLIDLGEDVENDSVSLPTSQELSKINSVFNVFDIFGRVKGSDPHTSSFLLKNLSSPDKKIALLSLNFTGMDSAELKASFVTPTLGFSQIRPDNIRSFIGTRDNIEIVLDTDLLLDHMVICEKEDESENVFNSISGKTIAGYEVVWPVNEKLLEFYSPERLSKMFDIKKEKDIFIVTLTLEMNGKIRTHEITKKYNIKRIGDTNRTPDDVGVCSVFEPRRLPFWAVWPYAKLNSGYGKAWKRYNFFCVDQIYNQTPVFKIEPYQNKINENFRESELSTIIVSAKKIFYRRCTELPTVLRISEQIDGSTCYRGSVLLKQPEDPKPINPESVWNVGVDFGTTSTSIFYNAGTGANFLRLLNEYRWREGDTGDPGVITKDIKDYICVFCNNLDKTDLDNLNYYFIDKYCLDQKGYTTTFEELNITNDSHANLFDSGRVFWHNYKNFREVNAVEGRRSHLKSDIKWEKDKKWAARYLNQMLTQVSFRAIEEGVGEIHWFFSYPSALSPDDLRDFKMRINSLIEHLNEETGINHKFDDNSNLLTESVAAALSFWKDKDNSTFLCLDIGGGTSDVSFWVRKDLKLQTSLKFASRDMFVLPLANLLKRQSVLDKVCKYDDVTDGINTMLRYGHKDIDENSIKPLIENVLFEYIIDFQIRLGELVGDDKKAKEDFTHLVYISYAGLFFYLSKLIISLLENNEWKEGIGHDIVIGLSGKGSRLTEWIEHNCKSIYKAAQELINQKTNLKITFIQKFKQTDAKTVTAEGLICNLNENGRQNKSFEEIVPKIFMGCSCNVTAKNGQTKNFEGDEFIMCRDPFIGKPRNLNVEFDNSSMSNFDEFINFLDSVVTISNYTVKAISREWYNDQKYSLLSKMTEHFNNQILDTEDRFDPPFIVMLKVFLKYYSEYLYEN